MYNFESDKILIVGAGLAGSTIGRILAENSFKVVILEKRYHLAGNIFDFVNEKKERIHKYGPHLLHCRKNSEALKFLSKFTKWVKYEHKVRALLQDGRTTPLPVNRLTIEDIFEKSFETEEATKEFLDNIRTKNFIPKNTDELSKNKSSITFIGISGLFKYIDIKPVVEIHIRIAKKFIRDINKF